MARIDSLLSILAQQGANELRLGTDREPKMLAFGAPKRLSIPSTPDDTLRELLGELLSDREEQLRAHGRVDTSYEAPGLGTFLVRLMARPAGGLDAIFVRDAHRKPEAPPARPAAATAAQPVASATATASAPSAAAQAAPALLAPPAALRASDALAQLVALAFSVRASDLHLTEGAVPVLRVDGALRSLDHAPSDVAALFGLDAGHLGVLAHGRSMDLALDVEGVGRTRIHVFKTRGGLAASVRLLPAAPPPLSSLHLPVPLEELAELPHGLVLVCGSTGSGKSTTLASLAQEILHRRSVVLTTLEDPVEYPLDAPGTSLVRRREVGRDVSDFAAGLRDALREDPDVVLVGEMRDPETIGLALTAAETGHLVLSSLHSRSAASAIERIVDAYPGDRQAQVRAQLADALRAVMVQRLLPRARGAGRLPCVEMLRGTHAVASLVREGRTAQIASALQSGRREGMISLERSLADRVAAGEIRLEDARAAANEPASLAMYLGKGDA